METLTCPKCFKEVKPKKECECNKSKLNGRVRPPCCYNCKYLGCITGQHDQPYPEIWCKKDVWHGVEDKETLILETECKLYKRAD